MRTADSIARQYASHNGLQLVEFSEVALPIYRVTANVLVHEITKLSTIDEFVLRAAGLGFTNVSELCGILGLTQSVVKGALTNLIRSELVSETAKERIGLTKFGAEASDKYSKSRPFEQQITFDYDGLVRRVRVRKDSVYLSPREVKGLGLYEIRPIPARKPSEDEVDIGQVSIYVNTFTNIGESDKHLLRIRKIHRATRLFYAAIMLIYKDTDSNRFEAAFHVDGRISEEHGLAFLKSKGLERLGMLQSLCDASERAAIEEEFPQFVRDHHAIGRKHRGESPGLDRLKRQIRARQGGDAIGGLIVDQPATKARSFCH